MSAQGKDKKNDLTPKQEAFALAYFETGNAAEAYRRAYDVSETAKDSWIYVEACQLLDHPKISLRLEELESQARKLSMFTRLKALDEYEEARQIAVREANPGAAVSATNGKVKLFGLEAPSKSRLEHVGKGGGPIQTQDVTEEALIEQARRLGVDPAVFGLTGGPQEAD